MRKLLVLLTLMLTLSVQAQDVLPEATTSNQHLKFMGIPMDCPASEFANKLVKEKGMKKLREDVNDMIILNGTFAGQSNCNVIIINGKNNTIKGIGVAYPINDSWDITQKRYLKLKSQLT